MLDLHELRILENLINTTFGKSSIREAGHAIAFKTMGHCDEGLTLEVRFESIVNINPNDGLQTAQKEYDDLSKKAIAEAIKQVKADFKDVSGRALKAKEFKSERKGQQPLRESHLEIMLYNRHICRGKYSRTIQFHIE